MKQQHILILLGIVVAAIVTYFLYHHKIMFSGAPTSLSLFHWNPHWQCFASGNTCCSSVAVNYVNSNLTSRNVDFANIIEMEIPNYQPPTGFQIINAQCGGSNGDYISLIYNSNKWTPIGTANKYCIGGRPTIIQQFSLNNNTSVYVIASHFTHHRDNYVQALNNEITALGITTSNNIIFMADTNQTGSSQQLISDILGSTPSNIMSSNVTGTCCFDQHKNSQPFSMSYDRIITVLNTLNFSNIITTSPTLSQVIPNLQPNCSYSEMHLPVMAVLH